MNIQYILVMEGTKDVGGNVRGFLTIKPSTNSFEGGLGTWPWISTITPLMSYKLETLNFAFLHCRCFCRINGSNQPCEYSLPGLEIA